MGEIADQIVNGECCEFCCMPLEEPTGYPVRCHSCAFEVDEVSVDPISPNSQRLKSTCPICKRRIKSVGLLNHIESEHGQCLAAVVDTVLQCLEGVEE